MASFGFALSRVTLLYKINQAIISTLDFKLAISVCNKFHEKVATMQALLAGNFLENYYFLAALLISGHMSALLIQK